MPRQTIQDIILGEVSNLRDLRDGDSKLLYEVSQTLKSIEKQVTLTNGRVTRLEVGQEKQGNTLSFHRGGLYIAYTLIGVAVLVAGILIKI